MVLKCAPVGLASAPLSGARVPPKVAAAHYGAPEHKAWARGVMVRAGWRCQVCGRGGRLFADHVVEIRDGGAALDPANGQALCGSHHTSKTARERDARFARRPLPEGMGV